MYRAVSIFTGILFLLLLPTFSDAQQQDRFQVIENRLVKLAAEMPGLQQKVQLSISDLPVQEYLGAMSRSNGLSISTDPKLIFTVNDMLSNVTPINVLLYLAKKYNLDIQVVGDIIMVSPYNDRKQFRAPDIQSDISYNAAENTLSLSLNDDSLIYVARMITQLSKKNVVVPKTMQAKKVTAFIQDASFETALEKLAFANEIKMVKTSDGYYLFQPLGEGEELYVNGENKTAARHLYPPQNSPAPTYAEVTARLVDGHKLISADANNAPIIDLIQQASEALGINYSVYSEIRGTIKLHLKNQSYDKFLSLLFKGTDYTFHDDDGVYLIGDRKIEGLRSFKAIHLQHRSIDTIVAMLPVAIRANIDIKEFKEQNTILLSGSASQITEVESIIRQLDLLVPVIMIEVTLIDIHNTRSVSTGISAGVSDSAKTGGTVLPGFNYTFNSVSINKFLNGFLPVNLGRVTPNFYVSLKALEDNTNVDVRATPKLTALNGHVANLSIGNTVYYKSTTQNLIPYSTSSQSIFVNNFTPSKADLSVDIRPVVSGDEQVTLNIKVGISSFTSIPTDGSPPPISTSKFESSIRVNNEDMVVLGGIERTEKALSSSGFPILSRIPVLNWIFGSRTKTNTKVVTLVFIKPTILR